MKVDRSRRTKRRKSRQNTTGAPLTVSKSIVTIVDPRDIIQRILADPIRNKYLRWGYDDSPRVSEFNQTPYVRNFLNIHEMTFFETKHGVFYIGDMNVTSGSKYVLIEKLAYVDGAWRHCQDRLAQLKAERKDNPASSTKLTDLEITQQFPELKVYGTCFTARSGRLSNTSKQMILSTDAVL